MLIKSRTFWVATAVFLLVGAGIGWFVFPAAYHTFQDRQNQSNRLDSQINSETQYINNVKSLAKQPQTINSLYQTASGLLPASTQSDLLALQLDGLLSNLGLTGFNVTVPLTGSSAAREPTIQAGGVTSPSFTLAGPASFSQLQSLLAALRTFGRWNKVSSVEITQSGTGASITVIANVFSRSAAPAAFTGSNSNLLTQAATLFSPFKSYATIPDVTSEGHFGRSDPFAATK